MKKWHADEVVIGKLTAFLNQIEDRGGVVFAVTPSPRRDFTLVVWYTDLGRGR